jgi:hypothetical protein
LQNTPCTFKYYIHAKVSTTTTTTINCREVGSNAVGVVGDQRAPRRKGETSIKMGTILSMKVGKFVVVLYCTDSERDSSKFFRRKQDIVVTLIGTTVTLQTAYMLSTEGCKI